MDYVGPSQSIFLIPLVFQLRVFYSIFLRVFQIGYELVCEQAKWHSKERMV